MACALPVICSNTGSLPEVVGDGGLVVDCGNIESLSRALIQLTNDKSLHSELRSKGLERSKKFDLNNCALETLNVYQMVAKQYQEKYVQYKHKVAKSKLNAVISSFRP